MKDWNQRTTTYDYDNLGRLEWTHRPNGTKRHVTYDDEGQITRIEELNIDGRVIALFSYPQYWDNGQPAKEFSVPALPLGAKAHRAAMSFDFENRVATWNGEAVFHDDDGNMTAGPLPPLSPGPGQASPGLGAFGYDTRNRLLSCNGVSYTYDAENLRTNVTTAAGDTTWVINPAGAPPQPLVRILPDGTVTRYIWGLGLLYEEDDATGRTKTYHYDRRGSTMALSADDGRTVTDRWAYGPYGERLSHSGASDTSFQFSGFFGVQTDSNGLHYMNARYYNTELRRFINADPLGLSAGPNLYTYCDGDPIMRVDPDGQFWFLVGAAIGGGLDYARRVASNYASGQTGSDAWTNINLTSIGLSAAGGALTGGIGGVVSKQVASVAGRAVINGVANATVSASVQVAMNATGVNGAVGHANIFSAAGTATAWGGELLVLVVAFLVMRLTPQRAPPDRRIDLPLGIRLAWRASSLRSVEASKVALPPPDGYSLLAELHRMRLATGRGIQLAAPAGMRIQTEASSKAMLRVWFTLGMFAFGFGVGFIIFGIIIWVGTRSVQHLSIALLAGVIGGLLASIGFLLNTKN